jgi:hypothetical protein
MSKWWWWMKSVSVCCGVALCIVSIAIKVPLTAKWPDLFAMLNAIYSMVHFVAALGYFNYRLVTIQWTSTDRKTHKIE